MLLPLAALAQETTSSIRIDTYRGDGTPASGVTVTVTDTRTGSARSNTTGDAGTVTFAGLRVGGPYTVTTSGSGVGDQTVTDIFLRLGETYLLPLSLSTTSLEEVIVTAAQVQTQQLALGPASTFGLADLQDSPAINRDIRDIIRFDPRVYQDVADVGNIQCAGANPRFNSLTVDGVRLNDNFGLNRNGYPTERQPFSFDSLQQVAVELAPFDVQYGGFTACNINAVTKSGTNEFHGSAFFDYTNDDLRGDSLEGDKLDLGNFSEERYGFNVGGPILKDKLWFFVAYEKQDGANLFDRGPVGSGRAVEVLGVSQEQYDTILDTLLNIYDYDPGSLPASLPNEDEKYTIKLDWDITDTQRFAFTYNYNDGFNIAESDGDSDELEFSNHYYERGAELTSYTGALFSDWTDRFSTEIRASFLNLDNRQISLGNNTFGEFQIETWNQDTSGNWQRAVVYAGGDDSRQANDLEYDTINLKLAGTYALDNHILTFGYERDDLEVFNLFLQHVRTENRFDEECGPGNANGCIQALIEGRPDDVYYGNAAPDNNPIDAAADWGYVINTAYFQDEMILANGTVTVVAGLRYDWYESDDFPTENPNFVERQGFTNADNFDGEDLLQPRLGVTWDVNGNLVLRGGVGLFSGGNPNVWLSNNFSNDGITQIQLREGILEDIYGRDFSLFDIPLGPDGNGRPGYDVPTDFFDAVANSSGNSGVNALDPNFKIPSAWKANLGASWFFGNYYTLTGDILWSRSEDSAIVINGTAQPTGTAPDGRPIYTDPRRFRSDFILTNVTGDDAESLSLSLALSAQYDNGFDWSFGYAYTDAEEVSPMTSSVAFSNFANIAVSDFNNPGLATANYEIPHRFVARMGYEAFWWGDNRTKFTLFAQANEGRPFSYTFARDDGDVFGDFIDNRHLLYVPDGPNDPLVTYGDNFDQEAFFQFLDDTGLSGYGGGIAPRNEFNSGWWGSFDIRIEQEFPGFAKDHRFAAFMIIRNFCNLLDDSWCTFKEVSFPRRQAVVDMELDTEANQYLYETFLPGAGETRVSDPSLYEIRLGIRYDF